METIKIIADIHTKGSVLPLRVSLQKIGSQTGIDIRHLRQEIAYTKEDKRDKDKKVLMPGRGLCFKAEALPEIISALLQTQKRLDWLVMNVGKKDIQKELQKVVEICDEDAYQTEDIQPIMISIVSRSPRRGFYVRIGRYQFGMPKSHKPGENIQDYSVFELVNVLQRAQEYLEKTQERVSPSKK